MKNTIIVPKDIFEKYLANIKQEGGSIGQEQPNPQQILEAYAESIQKDPRELMQMLQQMSAEKQQEALSQMYQALQQGAQNPQEEQAEGQMSNPQEEQQEMKRGGAVNPAKNSYVSDMIHKLMADGVSHYDAVGQAIDGWDKMQEGGEIQYAQEGVTAKSNPPKIDPRYTFFTPGNYDLTPERQLEADYLRQGFVKGYDGLASGGVDPNERVAYQNQQLPYLMRDSQMYDGKKANLKNTGKFQQEWANYRDSTVKAVNSNPYLSAEQKKNYLSKLEEEKFKLSYNSEKNKAKNSGGYDSVYGLETSEKGGFNLPLITEEDKKKYPKLNFLGDVLDENGKVKAEFKDLDPTTLQNLESTYKETGKSGRDIGLGTVQNTTTSEATAISAEKVAAIEKAKGNRPDRVVVPNIPTYYGQAPTPPEPVYKGDISLDRLNPTKISIEPNLVEASRQMMGAQGSLEGLSPTQRAVAIQNMYTQNQGTTNQAISNAQIANDNSQRQVDMFNIGQSGKERLTNLNNALSFEQRNLGGKAKYEANLDRYFNNIAAVDRQNWQDVNNLNYLNAKSDNFQTDGTNFYRSKEDPVFYDSSGRPVSKMSEADQVAVYKKQYDDANKKLKKAQKNA